MTPDIDWRQLAACRDHPADDWFPNAGESAKRERAVRICRHECPVIAQCAEYALRTQPPFGVWGGLTQRQLTALIGTPGARRSSGLSEYLLQPHGTPAAARRHYRNGEKLCPACLEANARQKAKRARR